MTPEQRAAMREEAERDVLQDVTAARGQPLAVSGEAVLALLAERDALEQERDRLAARHAEPAPADLVECVRRALSEVGCSTYDADNAAAHVLAALSDRLLKPGHVQVSAEYLDRIERMVGK